MLVPRPRPPSRHAVVVGTRLTYIVVNLMVACSEHASPTHQLSVFSDYFFKINMVGRLYLKQ